MLKFVKALAIGLAVVVVLFLGVVAIQPNEFRITRSTTINASSPAVFDHVDDFHKWHDWSPWAKIDPNCKTTFEGPSSGKDAKFIWDGNDEVGAGSMTILDTHPTESIDIKLEFLRPFQGTNKVEFTFKPEGDKTLVTWTMTGQQDFIRKAFCLLFQMNKMVGADFDKGLKQLKAEVEGAART